MRPRIGFAALELLERAGCEVVVPDTQTCCGQPGYNAGDRASALALARKVVGEFEACDYVVVRSGSCAGMIRTHFPDLFPNSSRPFDTYGLLPAGCALGVCQCCTEDALATAGWQSTRALMGCRWSEVQILSPRPSFNQALSELEKAAEMRLFLLRDTVRDTLASTVVPIIGTTGRARYRAHHQHRHGRRRRRPAQLRFRSPLRKFLGLIDP